MSSVSECRRRVSPASIAAANTLFFCHASFSIARSMRPLAASPIVPLRSFARSSKNLRCAGVARNATLSLSLSEYYGVIRANCESIIKILTY